MTCRTVVFFHAHPDDEVLLTGGTIARLAAEGHRTVLVTATAGEGGLASGAVIATTGLGEVRRRELGEAAAILGCAEVVPLGYADSGMRDAPRAVAGRFVDADADVAARRLADVLADQRADAVTIYDPAGGYGHPDHVQVHEVGRRAARLASLPLVLEATVDRRALQRALRLVRLLRGGRVDGDELDPARFETLFSDPRRITHRVDVRPFLDRKRAAMAAHASQGTSDDGDRSLAWFLRLPRPAFALAFGHEWYVEPGRTPRRRRLDDPLSSLR